MPLISRYVGASATESNCSDPFTTPAFSVASSLSAPRCVVAIVKTPRAVSASRIAPPNAAPSAGSVPDPSSSMSTRLSAVAPARISPRLRRCALNVDRLAWIDCSSPMSAKQSSKIAMRLSAPTGAGISGLCQRRDEPHGFQQHGLAAGVRTGEKQRALACRHLEIEGYHRAAAREQQRMPRLAQTEALVRRDELRRRASELLGKARARVQRVERDECFERCDHLLAQGSNRLGELGENALDFLALLSLERANAISELDRGRRLDEHGAARRRFVMHDATDRRAPFASHGNDVATIAHRHRHVGHSLVGVELRHCSLEQLHELTLRTSQLATQAAERARRFVAHRSIGIDRALDLVLHLLRHDEWLHEWMQHRAHYGIRLRCRQGPPW